MSDQATLTESSSPSVTPDPTPWIPFDHVWIMHLSSNGSQVMMCEKDGEWDFPYFFCRRSARILLHECCNDYQKSLGIHFEKTCFTLLCELMGDQYCDGEFGHALRRFGKAQLLWVEQHIPSFELPEKYAWKDLAFVQSLERDVEKDPAGKFVAERVAAALISKCSVVHVDEHRYQIGWHSKACRWLVDSVKRDGAEVIGNVHQYRVAFSSTTLVVNSSNGWYFLKAPLAGSGEVATTCGIATVMPDDTLDVVGRSEELGAFISRGFKPFYEKKAEKGGGEECTSPRAVLEALASFQLRSIEFRDRLLAAGVPFRDLTTIITELGLMKEDQNVWKKLAAGHPLLVVGLPYLEELFSKLKEYNIPMVLTHGDYGQRNFGFKKGRDGTDQMILFDWQFGSISHPFLEFYNSGMLRLSDDDLKLHMDEYLEMWSDFEPLDRAREAFALAQPLGRLLRAVNNLDCARSAHVELEPPVATFAFDDLWAVMSDISPSQEIEEAKNA